MKRFRKTFASIPLRLAVFAVLALGMFFRGGERTGVMANPLGKKDFSSSSLSRDEDPMGKDHSNENLGTAANVPSPSAQTPLAPPLDIHLFPEAGEGVKKSHDLLRRAPDRPTIDK